MNTSKTNSLDWSVASSDTKQTRDNMERNYNFCAQMEEELKELEQDASRYHAIKEKIEYSCRDDGMRWASLDWCVEVNSLSPESLDEAIDQILLAK